ncbi:MAG: hypothetical protein GAK45_01768 [Pseudomonas citronellolis]|nr:MAG: hypothetical protein GAK45_01768 [Pseudomonas citronellolis]
MAKDKRLPLAMTVAALLLSREASALGLGDITLHSALNQPLDAEIALQDVGDLTPDELLAHLADAATFERLGLDRTGFLQNLRFTPVIRGGRGFIHVVSTLPVREPFLNFLLEVERPNGHLLREYTVLLDPPGYGAASASRNAAPIYAEGTAATSSQAPRRQRASAPALPSVQATPGEGRYTVVRNDTLWRIAGRLDSKHSNRQQLMAQLYQLNPQAFVGNDPHRLRVGQVLVLPAELGQVGNAANAATPAPPAASAPTTNTAPANDGAAPAAPSTPQSLPATAPTDPATQLGQSQEQLTQLTAEREQLNQRMDQLQQQLTNLQQQLDSRDRQVQDLQRQVAAPVAPVAAPAEPAAQAPEAAAPASAAPVAPLPAPAPTASVDESDGTPWYLWLAGALLVLLVLALLLYRRQQRAAAQVSAPIPSAPAARAAVPRCRRCVWHR